MKPVLLAVVALGLGLPSAPLSAQEPRPITFGVVIDGPADVNPSYRALLQGAIAELLAGEFTVHFPPDKELTADWTDAGIRRAFGRLLADREVDLVLTFGAIASDIAARWERPLPKPVVAPFVLDAGLQGLPERDGASGVANLTYVAIPAKVAREIEVFREVVPFQRLAVLAHRPYLEGIPALRRNLETQLRDLGIAATIVPVDSTPAQALAGIPLGTEAVYVGFLAQLGEDGLDALVRVLNDRGLPSYTAMGEDAVARGFLVSAVREVVGQRIARRVALNVQRILLGDPAADIPIGFARDERVTINMATARAIGVSPPWAVLTEARLVHQGRDDVDRTVTLAQAVREAVGRNLDLVSQEFTVQAGEALVRGARAPLLPQLGGTVTGTLIDQDRAAASFGQQAERSATASASLSQVLFSESARGGLAIERRLQEQRLQVRDEVRLDIILEAAVAYLNVLRAKTLERVQQDDLRVSRSNLELAEVRQSVGTAAAGEVARWQAEIARSRQAVITANSQRNVAEIQLNRLVHRDLEAPFQTAELALGDLDIVTNEPRLKEYLRTPAGFRTYREFMAREAVLGSPELRQVEAGIAAQERSRQVATRAFFLPNLTLQGSLTQIVTKAGAGSSPGPIVPLAPNDLSWSVGLRLSYPIFTGGGRGAARARATLELDELRTRRLALAERVEQRVRSEMHEMGATHANIALARDAAAAAERNRQLVTDAYGRGVASVTDLIDAQNAALVAELGAANATYDFLVDLMQVERAIGSFSFFATRADRQDVLDRLDAFAAARDRRP